MTEPLHFDPSARLQKFLGRELIADPNLAIAEFVKNSYDAGATHVEVEFRLEGPLEEHVVWISDDGVGMTYEEFRDNWMRPGFSQKAGKLTTKTIENPATARQRMESRLPIGEKGIGRLAAGRLGDVLHVWTRKRKSDPWLHVLFDWDEFDDMNTPLTEVLIQPDYETPPPDSWPEVGTVLEISSLTLNWAGSVPGRRVAGRETVRLGRLRQDLELVISPLAATKQDFEIELVSDLDDHEEFTGLVGSADMRLLDYRYDFDITFDERRGVRVWYRVQRAPDLADELGRERISQDTLYFEPESDPEADATVHPGTLECGQITGSMYYAARKGLARRMQEFGIQPGVHVYRDGIRVEPYGNPEDDWLGVQARKASRQGYAAIRPNTLYGYVQISKQTNPELIDMTNRQGLVENDAYDEFVAHMRAVFRRFAEVVFEEFVQPEWAKDADRARAVAARTTSDRDVLIRDIVHELRQPVSSLGTEMRNLDFVLKNHSIPKEPRQRLEEIRDRANGHLTRIADVVRMALEVPDTSEIEPVSTFEVVQDAVRAVESIAETHHVQIDVELADRVVLARRDYLRRAIAELLRNAIQATRRGRATPASVRVTASTEDGEVLIRVSDNGVGVDRETAAKLFKEPISKKGRQGEGLTIVPDLLAVFGASVRLANPGEPGAVFEILIPSMGEVRRMLR